MHLSGDWQGRDLDDWVRQLAKEGKLPALSRLVEETSFAAIGEQVTYPVSGSFVRFLVRTRGLPSFKQIYPAFGRTLDVSALNERMQEIYGSSLADLERAWRTAVLGE